MNKLLTTLIIFLLTPSLFAAVMLAKGAPEIAGHLAREVSRDALRFILLAGACYGLGATLGTAVGSTFGGAVVAGGVGTLLYLGLLPFVAPTQVDLVMRLLRPRLRARRTGPRAAT